MTATLDRDVEEYTGPPSFLRRYRWVLAIAGLVVLALITVWLVVFSSVFGVRTVDVQGTRTLTVAQVSAAAAITDGTPLVRLDTAAVARRIGQLPGVASVRVSTSFPSTVDITVVERVAVAYTRDGTGWVYVDRTGAQFSPGTARPKGLPLLVVPTGPAATSTGAAEAGVAMALPVTLRPDVRSIQALSPAAITLVLKHGVLVHWGSAERNAQKARLLPVLLKQRPMGPAGVPAAVTQVDLSNPDQPFVR